MKIIIDDKEYTKFTNYVVKDYYNAIAGTFAINGLGKESYEMGLKSIIINDDNGELIMLGTIMQTNSSTTPTPEEPNISGYTDVGILEDCNHALKEYPLERSNMNLEDIVRLYAGSYSQGLIVHQSAYDRVMKPFDKISPKSTDIVKDIINKLALERGLFLSHKENGLLFFVLNPLTDASYRPDAEKYITAFSKQINYQPMHSDITVELQADDKNDGNTFTINNKYCTKFRQRTVTMANGDASDIEGFAKKILASEMLNITCTFDNYLYLKIGTVIPFEGVNWFITEVTISGDATGEYYSYKAVLEEVYKI
jgi:prophage tail gpP-like protein